ncbi:MAG: acetyl-CoA carboxylase, carboxyltransferase subunit beta [Christensenellales bacterium]
MASFSKFIPKQQWERIKKTVISYSYRNNMMKKEPTEQPVRIRNREVAEKWQRCAGCSTSLSSTELSEYYYVCPQCGYHFRIDPRQRIAMVADEGSFVETEEMLIGKDPLEFPGYMKKLDQIREETEEQEGIVTGECRIQRQRCVIAIMNSFFMMGSMGVAVGEKFTRAAEYALENRIPLLAFTASGGARMQEGLISLTQMSKTSAVIERLNREGILYISVITDPTTGGVTASFASLGDIILAEPGATIGFAGRRVIEQTTHQTLPDDFQTAEFMLKKGFIDAIVPRPELRGVLSRLISLHQGGKNRE